MKMKRALLVLLALLLLPGITVAQTQTRNTFLAAKLFTDGNPNEVDVTLSCNTGLPINQTKSIEPLLEGGDYVDFVVVEFDSGELDCEITEDVPDDYSVVYFYGQTDLPLPVTYEGAEAMAGDVPDIGFSEDGCFFENVEDESADPESEYFCLIINIPDPVEVVVQKDWVIENSGNGINGISTQYEIDVRCDGPILDISSTAGWGDFDNYGEFLGISASSSHAYWEVESSSDATFTVLVRPDEYGQNECRVDETVYDSAVEVSNNCGSNVNFDIDVGGGPYECTVTNTVFFEGIPTLNRYGLAILALVMLGVGFVAFRRFA